MKRVFYPDMEIAKQLNEYRVEYQVLQEEMISVKPQIENMEKLEMMNKQLTQQVAHLNNQLEVIYHGCLKFSVDLQLVQYITLNSVLLFIQVAMSNLHRLETTRSVHVSSVHKMESQNRSLEVTVATLGSFIQQLIDSRMDVEIPGDVRRIVAQLGVAEKRRNSSAKSYPLKVLEDNNNRYEPMKSNSTGRDASRLLKSNSLMEAPYPLKSALSQPNLGTKLEKMSSFFANSHNHIRQQRAQMAALRSESTSDRGGNNNNDENDPKSVNIDIQITDTVNPTTDATIHKSDNALKIDALGLEKSVSLPLSNAKMKLKPAKSAYELGSVRKIPTTRLEDTCSDSNSSLTGTVHPLDTCSDVNFKYGGTTKLKSIKPNARLVNQTADVQGDPNMNKEMQQGQTNPEILTR